MTFVVGVDGCKGQWLAVAQDMSGSYSVSKHATPEAVLESFPSAGVIAVDVPIGLTETGARYCDGAARALLGWPRRNSVFPAPIRPMLEAITREDACKIGKSIDGRGVSCQSWGIFPYVRSWDDLMRSSKKARTEVYEVHPELCFYGMNKNMPMQYSKRSPAGLSERRGLLDCEFDEIVINRLLAGMSGIRYSMDDFYDALAALWTANRIANKCAIQIPEILQVDSLGLRMGIHY